MAVNFDAMPGARAGKHNINICNSSARDTFVEGISKPVRKARNCIYVGRHRSDQGRPNAPLLRDRCTSRANKKDGCAFEVTRHGIQNAFAERTSKALLRAKQDQAAPLWARRG